MVLGSRPPNCVNRCFSCRPCMAALVASPTIELVEVLHIKVMKTIICWRGNANVEVSSSNHEQD
ncbi:hypothetical protein CRYUN_Cryun03dG0070100 [Craigia yunnanensis]